MDRPISTVKTAWKGVLKRAGVPHFPIYVLTGYSEITLRIQKSDPQPDPRFGSQGDPGFP
jgi:hypothetical protein